MATHGHREAVVAGACATRFELLRQALADIMVAGIEVGAALVVRVDKEPVVDLRAGHADAARTRPWQADTLVNLFSVGKAISAVCLLRLIEAGRVDLDAIWCTPRCSQAGGQRMAAAISPSALSTRRPPAWRSAMRCATSSRTARRASAGSCT